jgi:hypothetical protein
MRTALHAVAIAITVGAIATLVSSPGLAAPAREELEVLKLKHPKNYAACRTLARQRGFRTGDPSDLGGRRFVIQCIQGRRS